MRVLGIDPGYAIVGWGVVDYAGNRFAPVDFGAVCTDAGVPFERRLDEVYAGVKDVIERTQPDCPPEEFGIFKPMENGVPALPYYGGEYLFDVTSTSHDYYGSTCNRAEVFGKLVRRLVDKLEDNVDDIAIVKKYYDETEPLDTLIITFGCTTRSAREGMKRCSGTKVGVLQLVTLTPLPEKEIKKACQNARHIVVAELNHGMLALDIERIIKDKPVHRLGRNDGTVITPQEIVDFVNEVSKN